MTSRAKAYTDSTGAFVEIPVLLTPAGVLDALLDYFLCRSHDRSLSWMRKVAWSVTLFLEYLVCNPAERDSYRLFQNFAQRLYTGTFDRVSGLDPSWLCWRARSPRDAQHIVTYLTDFFDWLNKERPALAKVNPQYAGGAYDRMTDEAAYQYRRDKAFLGHSWAANATEEGHRIRYRRPPQVEPGDGPAFPDDRFEEFLFKGFKVGGRYDYRCMLITLLLHGAGFRESEPFHLYFGDVVPDPRNPRQALVHIHHPEFGTAPSDWPDERGHPRKGNRRAYLAEKFGLAPRTELMDSRHAGWKGGLHDGAHYKQAFWFEPKYGEWFLALWYRYLEQVAYIDRNHPFAFVNTHREPIGGMYAMAQFDKAHGAACERVGLPVSKALGTTEHGHRHAYGRRLRKAGIDKQFIRRFMHHASIESQEVYTQPDIREMYSELKAGAQRLQQLRGNTSSQSGRLPPDFDFTN